MTGPPALCPDARDATMRPSDQEPSMDSQFRRFAANKVGFGSTRGRTQPATQVANVRSTR